MTGTVTPPASTITCPLPAPALIMVSPAGETRTADSLPRMIATPPGVSISRREFGSSTRSIFDQVLPATSLQLISVRMPAASLFSFWIANSVPGSREVVDPSK